ncbi:endonuclease/exonuclease/phosphatase family protein [Devosia sp. 2618]|uniref:endonuclease/exonuclease/phosphatase family protein n=1 Tax=Devosia sp. 2618 TaxID=3156454 RepID=UPI00339A6475
MKILAELRGLLTGAALAGFGLLVAIDGPSLLPGQDLLQSLRFLIAAGLILLAIVMFIARAWMRGLAVLVIACLSIGYGAWIIYDQQQARNAKTGEAVATATVLSFNTLAYNSRGSDIVDYMIETAPDVAVIMESEAIHAQLDRLATFFPARAGCDATGQDCDLMMFSRTPLTDVQVIPLKPLNRLRLVTAKTEINGQSVTIVGVHLSKPYFDETAWVELFHIRDVLRQIEGPVILSGDFNAAAWSKTVSRFAKGASLIPPPFYPATWPVRFGALGVPIDNMFTRGDALIESISAMPDSLGSNHRGLLAKIGLY